MTFSTCTHVRVAQDLPRTSCVTICTFFKSHFVSSCSNVFLIDVPESSSFCSTPPPPQTTSHLLTGTRQTMSATPRGGLRFGVLAEYNALTGYEPNSLVEVSSEHTPIYYPCNEHGFYTKSDHTATVAASENLDGFQQQAAASSSQHCVEQASGNRCDDSRSVANSWLSADMCKYRKTVAW